MSNSTLLYYTNRIGYAVTSTGIETAEKISTDDTYEMTCFSKLDQEGLKSQCSVLKTTLEYEQVELAALSEVFGKGQTEMIMEGDTADVIWELLADYVQVISWIQMSLLFDADDTDTLSSKLGSVYIDGSVVLHGIEYSKASYESECRAHDHCVSCANSAKDEASRQSWLSEASSHQDLANSYYSEWMRYLGLKRHYEEVNASTASLYTTGAAYRAKVQEAIEILATAFDGTGSYVVPEGFAGLCKDIEDLNNNYLMEYAKKWKTDDGKSWDMDKLGSLISKDADALSELDYMALSAVYDTLTEDEMAKFIESAYIETNYWEPTYMDYHDGGDYSKAKIQYTASSAFIVFSDYYRNVYNVPKEGINDKQLRNNNILYIFSSENPVLYTIDDGSHTKNLGITILSEDDCKVNTLTITAGQALSGEAINQKYRLNGYDTELDEYVDLSVIEYNKYDGNNEKASSVIFAGGETVIGMVAKYGDLTTPVIGVFECLRGYCSAAEAENEAIARDEFTKKYINFGNYLTELEISGTVINRYDDGHECVYLTNVNYDSQHVASLISEWNTNNPSETIDCTPDQFVETFLGNDNSVEPEIMDDFLQSLVPPELS